MSGKAVPKAKAAKPKAGDKRGKSTDDNPNEPKKDAGGNRNAHWEWEDFDFNEIKLVHTPYGQNKGAYTVKYQNKIFNLTPPPSYVSFSNLNGAGFKTQRGQVLDPTKRNTKVGLIVGQVPDFVQSPAQKARDQSWVEFFERLVDHVIDQATQNDDIKPGFFKNTFKSELDNRTKYMTNKTPEMLEAAEKDARARAIEIYLEKITGRPIVHAHPETGEKSVELSLVHSPFIVHKQEGESIKMDPKVAWTMYRDPENIDALTHNDIVRYTGDNQPYCPKCNMFAMSGAKDHTCSDPECKETTEMSKCKDKNRKLADCVYCQTPHEYRHGLYEIRMPEYIDGRTGDDIGTKELADNASAQIVGRGDVATAPFVIKINFVPASGERAEVFSMKCEHQPFYKPRVERFATEAAIGKFTPTYYEKDGTIKVFENAVPRVDYDFPLLTGNGGGESAGQDPVFNADGTF